MCFADTNVDDKVIKSPDDEMKRGIFLTIREHAFIFSNCMCFARS